MGVEMQSSELVKLTVITGGARSGKSALAEKMAADTGLAVVYFATMGKIDHDLEAHDRIALHTKRRPTEWRTIEEPLMLSKVITELPGDDNAPILCLIDCLSLFVSNLLLSIPYTIEDNNVRRELEANLLKDVDDFLSAIGSRSDLRFIVVTNEVGSGIVPDNHLARSYRDMLGLANQKIAAQADQVYLSVSGLALKLK